MGKVHIPHESTFVRKAVIALLILIGLVLMSDFALKYLGVSDSFQKSIQIVTHVEIVTEQIGFKYFFAFLSLIGGVVQFYLVYVILEFVLDGKFQNIFFGVEYMKKAARMSGHYVIAGGGRVGTHVARGLKEYKKDIVLIDENEDNITRLRDEGFTAIKGDALDVKLLKKINIEKVKHLFACLAKDSDNILLVLTVRELNPGIKISARAHSDDIVSKLQHAGASYVVVPAAIGGEELAKTARSS